MRTCLRLVLTTLLALTLQSAHADKILRYAFSAAENGFDPAKVIDLSSRTVTAHIFEGLYDYDALALPAKVIPMTASSMPEISDEFKTYTIHIRPGIYFADDPVFKGQKRELVAADYVYSFKRLADPANKSPAWASLNGAGMLGLAELRRATLKDKKPFDYDSPIEGLRALDRYTLQIKLAQPQPSFVQTLAAGDLLGAVAREVIEAYGKETMAHPVGTGPFFLKKWRRSSLIELARNPAYRERHYEAQPAADDAEGQAIAARLNGRLLPMIDGVVISIIEESQPRWLDFLNGQQDFITVPPEFVNVALPRGRIAPNLAKRGMQLHNTLASDALFFYFNMDDPTVGGYTPDKVALRRAVSLAWDTGREIRLLRRGQALPAQSALMPYTSGYDPNYKSEISDYDPARANALLDMYGYVDKDGDGWRDMPDGSPLVLEWATQPDGLSRSYDEMFSVNMARLHIKTKSRPAKFPEQLKAASAGKLMMWLLGGTAASSDGLDALSSMYGPEAGSQNYSRFKNAEFDELYRRMLVMPDGPEREALFRQAKRIQAAFMPVKTTVHRINNSMTQPWLIGYRRPLFRIDFWEYVDIDDSLRKH